MSKPALTDASDVFLHDGGASVSLRLENALGDRFDMSLPKENILSLAKNAKVAIFDHHLGPVIQEVFHHNPVIKGEDPNNFPAHFNRFVSTIDYVNS